MSGQRGVMNGGLSASSAHLASAHETPGRRRRQLRAGSYLEMHRLPCARRDHRRHLRDRPRRQGLQPSHRRRKYFTAPKVSRRASSKNPPTPPAPPASSSTPMAKTKSSSPSAPTPTCAPPMSPPPRSVPPASSSRNTRAICAPSPPCSGAPAKRAPSQSIIPRRCAPTSIRRC
jgi:hypothetical protein